MRRPVTAPCHPAQTRAFCPPPLGILSAAAALQNINLGISRMAANGGNSNPAAWNGIISRTAAAHQDALTIAYATTTANAATPLMYQHTGTLSNEGETLTLRDAAGSVVDTVSYQTEFPWPVLTGSGTATVNPANIINVGIENSQPLGNNKFAYFEIASLKVHVIPEPGMSLLGGLGLLALLRRRRA